ncbi:hypothetical protein GCM10022243_13090 [Saccharothrix violaceirubra]|uniref:Uncharacterized protein n=1 Tax=Saccharothrix violaceirubra TaxID=413306 RepID=A0A7W7WYB7_9PSEU|nr:DUF6319 family protein [Saccharothrix violaceirubra]MBB4967548.1 hypothetical protein [Saccharothrix violaceirubra]
MAKSLSPEDVDQLRAELAAGRPPAVWFTAAAVGVEAGRSAKVVAFTEPAEGDFIQVRPTGTKDELSFSPAELTVEKPAPRKKVVAEPKPAREESVPAAPAPEEPIYTPVEYPYEPVPPEKPEKPTKQKSAPRKQSRPPGGEVTITLTSTPEGEWTVDLQWGSRRPLRATPVPPAAVGRAARQLLPEVAEAVDAVIETARERHLARVVQLRAELEEAQRALEELDG